MGRVWRNKYTVDENLDLMGVQGEGAQDREKQQEFI